MKIYTKIEWQWDDTLGKLVEINSESMDYNGPLSLCGSGYQHQTMETFYDKDGQEYTIVRRKKYSGGIEQVYKLHDYEIRRGGSDGEVLKRVGKNEGVSGAKSWLITNKAAGNPQSIMSESEYGDYKQTEEYTSEYEESLQQSEYKQKQAIEQAGKMQQTLQAQAGGQQMQAIKNALLQQGYTPEEAAQISSGGTESIQRGAAQVQQQTAAQKSGVEAQMAGMDIGRITSASDLENRLRQMTTQESQFNQQLAFQKQQAKAAESGWGDVLGSVVGMGVGALTGGFGTAAGTQLAGMLFNKGGEIPKYRNGGPKTSPIRPGGGGGGGIPAPPSDIGGSPQQLSSYDSKDEDYAEEFKMRSGGFSSGFAEGMKQYKNLMQQKMQENMFSSSDGKPKVKPKSETKTKPIREPELVRGGGKVKDKPVKINYFK